MTRDFYNLSSMDYLERHTPTRLTDWPGKHLYREKSIAEITNEENFELLQQKYRLKHNNPQVPHAPTKQLKVITYQQEVMIFESYTMAADYYGTSSTTISRIVKSQKPRAEYNILLMEVYNGQ
jgi:hypothetical protein